jgi:hypothetical protein
MPRDAVGELLHPFGIAAPHVIFTTPGRPRGGDHADCHNPELAQHRKRPEQVTAGGRPAGTGHRFTIPSILVSTRP